MSIKHVSFKHGWFYHYRVHEIKKGELCQNCYSQLGKYLEKMFEDCPDHYFLTGPRSSHLKLDININAVRIEGHEISKIAMFGLRSERYKTAHSNVQVYMLENDSTTVGVEVPIWIMPYELEVFRALFGCEEPLTGHIDVLRIEDGLIWIWDFKPGADKEKYASCQVFFYALMLSQRTGIPLEKFRCGYFDEKSAHVFQPDKSVLKKGVEVAIPLTN